MLVKYYNDRRLAYTTRNRYFNLSTFFAFSEEEQFSILLGNGAETSIKTNVSNLCNYVTIDNTRWFVVSYIYLNGGQIKLNLQRDVIGEFGIENCYGKIERGYTNNFLKYRKELGLNQRLKERKYLLPNTYEYGNYSLVPKLINNEDKTHNSELWGIFYLTNAEDVQINVANFTPDTVDYDFIKNNTKVVYGVNCYYNFTFLVDLICPKYNNWRKRYQVNINMNGGSDWYNYSNGSVNVSKVSITSDVASVIVTSDYFDNDDTDKSAALNVGYLVRDSFFTNENNVFTLPKNPPEINNVNFDYNNKIILNNEDNTYYKYSIITNNTDVNLSISNDGEINTFIYNSVNKKSILILTGTTYTNITIDYSYNTGVLGKIISKVSKYIEDVATYIATPIDEMGAGQITFPASKQLVDEPYSVFAFPLFDCSIKGLNKDKETYTYNISKSRAFFIFNSIIQSLSGENGYLVDAQVYPYCPPLGSVIAELKDSSTKSDIKYPIFSILSNNYTFICDIQLLPLSDIKKEYIERQYSIISPEQSGKFDFRFYDFVNKIEDKNGINMVKMSVLIKTALKPFAIISAAVIQPTNNSLIGITYESDFRGAQPSSNGFECSLASNAFETYKRQNSNYQQIFALQKEELQKQHSTELVNEITASIVNTTSAAAMGAIAGASAADVGLFKTGKPAGAAIGGAAAALGVGAAMTAQTIANEKLRDYEESVQQQKFDLEIGTIKNLPNSINRISSFNEIVLKDFWYIIETYECTEEEKEIVNNFIDKYGYGIGVFDFISNYKKNGWFIRSTLISSDYDVNLHMIAEKELKGGIYIYE